MASAARQQIIGGGDPTIMNLVDLTLLQTFPISTLLNRLTLLNLVLSLVLLNRNRNLNTSKALYSKAKRTRAPVYSRALRRIKGRSPKGGGQEKLRSDFQSTRRGQSSC